MAKTIGGALVILALVFPCWTTPALASTCEKRFKDAEERIREAEATLKPSTPALITQRLAEARSVLGKVPTWRPRLEASLG